MAEGNWWDKVKQNVGLNTPEEEPQSNSLLQHLDEASTLSRTQRIYGFGICIGLAMLFGLLSSVFFLSPTKFAILYTFSNISAIASTMFLMGPLKQLSKMFDKGRIVATCVYIASLALTLFAALKLHSIILTLVFLIIQLCALLWYCLSYIPFAREMVSRMVVGFVGE